MTSKSKRGGRTPPLQAIFGNTPRVRVVEAMIRLRNEQFTRAQLAQEAGVARPATYRIPGLGVSSEFEPGGALNLLIESEGEGGRRYWQLNREDPLLNALVTSQVLLDSALSHPPQAAPVPEAARAPTEVPDVGRVYELPFAPVSPAMYTLKGGAVGRELIS